VSGTIAARRPGKYPENAPGELIMAQPETKSSQGLTISRTAILLFLIFAFGISIRLLYLGKWSYHHDESIHAWYSYRLSEYGTRDDAGNLIYRYDPVYHGPFLYHIGSLFFFLFGDSNFTGRLPFATFGILLLILVYQLHHIIGKPRAIAALIFVAISPGITYFSRFARNDVYFATETLAIILFGMLYLREPKARWFYLLTFSFALLYATKENSYVAGAILCGFLVIYLALKTLWDGFFAEDWARTLRAAFTKYFELTALVGLYGIFSVSVFAYIMIPVARLGEEYKERAGAGSIDLGISRSVFQDYMNQHAAFFWVILILGILAGLFYLVAIHVLRTMMEDDRPAPPGAEKSAPEVKKQDALLERLLVGDVRFVVGLAIIICVYVFLFTTMFSNGAGLTTGITDYVRYWAAQVHKPRIAQAELGALYYVYFFIIYDLAAFLLALAAFAYFYTRFALRILSPFLGKDLDRPAPDEDRVPFVIPIFLTFWALGSLLIYPKLHERVPWLYTHQVLPAAILAGYFTGELYLRFHSGKKVFGFLEPKWVWRPVAAVIAVVAVFSLRADILLNLYDGDNPKELMVYVQSNRAVRKIAKEIDQVAFEAGTFEETRIGVDNDVSWPWSWYLRHYNMVLNGKSKQYPVIISDVNDHSQLQFVLGDDFEFKKYSFRDHWSPNYSESVYGRAPLSVVELPNGTKDRTLFGNKKWWKNNLLYFLKRKPWSPVGGAELMLYKKRQVREVPEVADCPAGFDQAPRPGRFVTSWGGPGSGTGQFRDPRAVAVSPDGHIYVADTDNYRVQKFTADGQFVLEIGGPSEDRDETGKFLRRVEGSAVLPGPMGIACDSEGNVYVADTWANRIQKFNSTGQFVTVWTAGGPGSFFGPRDVAVDAENRVYVADTGNKRIQVFDADGNYLRTIGKAGSGAAEFDEPVGIDFSAQNELYVADVGNKRIQVLRPNGSFIRQWNVCGWEAPVISSIEAYLATAPDGTVYVTDSRRNCVYQFDPQGNSVVLWGTEGGAQGQLRRPTGIAVDGQGFVYVSDMGNHRINKYRKY
jgi:uncharacterized protein (TIGR03663 family)